ncbi:hypothetical protein I317_00405 [Kwoniella heveanensis CBS 569]|nr:hypothetical protein I317_00405 [Kwoniella heveanensis CBS 569]
MSTTTTTTTTTTGTPMTEPTTPVRPPRSLRRLTLETPLSTPDSFEDITPPPPVPSSSITPGASGKDTPFEVEPTTPSTPKTPTRPRIVNRKSTVSIRRKPVPLAPEDLALESSDLGFVVHVHDEPLPATPSVSQLVTPRAPLYVATESAAASSSSSSRSPVEPPRYIPPVDPPLPSTSQVPHSPAEQYDTSIDFTASRPPSYAGDHAHVQCVLSSPAHAAHSSQDPCVDLSGGLGGPSAGHSASYANMMEDLPSYAKETETEPKTLARALWRWGFVCPLLWFIGMCIMWIPLKPIEEERDPEKAQKLEEMIVILRETELKYAKKCMWGFTAFAILLIALIVVGIVVSMKS